MFGKKQSLWPFVFFLIIVIILLSFVFWSKGSFVRVPDEPLPGCVVVDSPGASEDNIDLVFLGTNYDDLNEFIDDTYLWKDALLDVEPFNTYRNRFNFFRIENFEDYGCEWDEGYILCNTGKVIRASAICPSDYYIVLTDIEGVYNLINWLRSSTYQKVMAINTADDPLVLAHEMGHVFANFAEEYTEEGVSIWWDAPNCDPAIDICPKFNDVDSSSCIQGCTNFEYSRSVKEGIMRDYWHRDGKTYGDFDEFIITELIENMGSNGEQQKPQEILIVDVECEGENCSISSVEESYGFSDSEENQEGDSPVLRMESTGPNGELYGTFFVEPEEKRFDCYKTGKVTKINSFVKTLIIPNQEDTILNLYNSNNEVVSNYKHKKIPIEKSIFGVSGKKVLIRGIS